MFFFMLDPSLADKITFFKFTHSGFIYDLNPDPPTLQVEFLCLIDHQRHKLTKTFK